MNIVFDIGGVLADFRIREFLAEKGFDAALSARILKASVMNPYWERFERGKVTEEETLRAFAAADPEIGEALRTAFSDLSGMLAGRAFAIPLVTALRAAGHRVYYLSNYSKKAYDECGESLAFMPYMDGGVVSFKAGLTKPDARMFRFFLDRYGLRPETCVMVDDTPANVRAAQALGFAGIVFTSYGELLADLRKLGVAIGTQAPRPSPRDGA